MLSIKYHRIFDYELVRSDFPKWRYKTDPKDISSVASKKNKKRFQREKYSEEKLKIAKRAAVVLSKIPTIKFVGITGSLAMMSSNKDSDIDLLIITKSESLWTSRAFAYMVTHAFGLNARKPNDLVQKDKLCLNMWLDESDLVWDKKDRNLYTAHEIAQIIPLVNKYNIYERFLWENKWILNYWPNSVKIGNWKFSEKLRWHGQWKLETGKFNFLEKICYLIQYNYMKSKISREVVNPTRALFHPQDWGRIVLERLA